MPTAQAIDWDVITPDLVLESIEKLGVIGMVTQGAPQDPDERSSAYLAVLMAAVQAHLARRRQRHNELITQTHMRAQRWFQEASAYEAVARLHIAPPAAVQNPVNNPADSEVTVDQNTNDQGDNRTGVRHVPRHAYNRPSPGPAAETGCDRDA